MAEPTIISGVKTIYKIEAMITATNLLKLKTKNT